MILAWCFAFIGQMFLLIKKTSKDACLTIRPALLLKRRNRQLSFVDYSTKITPEMSDKHPCLTSLQFSFSAELK